MALAVQAASMAGSAESAAVHPFFTSTREKPPSNVPTNTSDTNHIAPEKSEITPAANAATKEMASNGVIQHEAQGIKDASTRHSSTRQQQLTLAPNTAVGDMNIRAVPKGTHSKETEISAGVAPGEENDHNERERKRRRVSAEPLVKSTTYSIEEAGRSLPEPHLNVLGSLKPPSKVASQEQQPMYAGFARSSPPPSPELSNRDEKLEGLYRPLDQPAQDVSRPMTPSKAMATPSTTPSTKSTPKKGTPRSAALSLLDSTSTLKSAPDIKATIHSPTREKTPPKKMLKLRNDGKLLSPKASKEGGKKRGRPRKGEERHQSPNQKLVRLAYGSDDKSRSELGQKIGDILSGVGKAIPQLPATNRDSKSTPPKVTHPFFTGKPKKGSGASLVVDLDAANDPTRSASTKSSPRRKHDPSHSTWAGFGSTFSKPTKFPGSVEPLWPPRDVMHVRGPLESSTGTCYSNPPYLPTKKLKSAVVHVGTGDEVLFPWEEMVSDLRAASHERKEPYYHKPHRRLLTGPELQYFVDKRSRSRLPIVHLTDDAYNYSLPSVSTNIPAPGSMSPHKAVLDLFISIKTSLSPFDKFECDNQDWAHKYAPKRASNVLQEGNELLLLRDWLHKLTVTSVDSGKSTPNAQITSELARKMRARAKKKRKRLGELDDFVISDEDGGYIDDLTDPEDIVSADTAGSLPRLTPNSIAGTKAVVLSGPHGCGKTASVYAVAQELGFEVFEINAGTRRSGKDILDKVGDMTKNHLVRQNEVVLNAVEELGDVQADIESGRQSTMGAFFQAKPNAKDQGKPKPSKKQSKKTPESPKKPSNQRQSLILLEEVDVLFEEDKNFWGTVLTLLITSRRPIIMTCLNDEFLPKNELFNCRAIRLASPSVELAADYLLMVAANEGHLLSLQCLEKLYRSQRHDLRSSITQLNYLCQMALGDAKNGLDWMLIRSNTEESRNERGESLRVVSDGTFTDHMGVLPDGYNEVSVSELDADVTFLSEAAKNFNFDVENWSQFLDPSSVLGASKGQKRLEALMEWDLGCDALSAADILPGSTIFEPRSTRFDASICALSEVARGNYTADLPVLNDVCKDELESQSLNIVLALKLLSRHVAFSSNKDEDQQLDPPHLAEKLLYATPSITTIQRETEVSISSALDPLSDPPTNTIIGNKGPAITTLEQPLSVLATDVAPYVRSIANFDIRLEKERLQLSGLLSQGGGGQKKKQRTTRASRAALEGGRKESTRRERWFSKDFNLVEAVATGPAGWNNLLEEQMTKERERIRLEHGDEDDGPELSTDGRESEAERRVGEQTAGMRYDGAGDSDED